MPQKHSKNQGAMGSMLTYAERKKLQDGTQSMRYGVDSQLPFGYCALTNTPVTEPVVTPSGHMYSREAIFEYLLKKQQDLKRQAAAYEAQESRRAADEDERSAASANAAVERFIDGQTSVIGEAASSHPAGKRRKLNADEVAAVAAAEAVSGPAEVAPDLEQQYSKETLRRTSYWVPMFAPEHRPEKVAPPPARPPSPNSGQGLRLKDLFAVNLELDQDTADVHEKKYVCAVSRKQITYQAAVLLKTAHCVVLESIYDQLVKPTMTCPVTGEKLRKKDVVKLTKAGSSFAAAGPVKVSVYRHTTT